jgi:sugar lactone lactonase YvrE
MSRPQFIAESSDESFLVASGGTNQLLKLWPDKGVARTLFDTAEAGLKDLGNAVYDSDGNVWVNEIQGCRVHMVSADGEIRVDL